MAAAQGSLAAREPVAAKVEAPVSTSTIRSVARADPAALVSRSAAPVLTVSPAPSPLPPGTPRPAPAAPPASAVVAAAVPPLPTMARHPRAAQAVMAADPRG
ncbi:hypothetical protein [Mycobacterium angelicum]|uniref:hypothetical protein n=1 Tax=Mycobacterium angelicum TaxID=470074 RepID=UPI00111C8210|nr:hypothetical protein [Mycobacterium angelicum]